MGVDLDHVHIKKYTFYLAFEAKDYEAMAHLWSKQREVLCLHPGWMPLIGRDAVLESWRQILSNPQQGQVSFYGASVHQLGDDTVAVVCYEEAGNSVMVATNIFAAEDDTLRLVSHQAGYCADPPAA